MEAGVYRGLGEQKLKSLLLPEPNPYLAGLQLKPELQQSVKVKTGSGDGCAMLVLMFVLGLLVGLGIAFLVQWLAGATR